MRKLLILSILATGFLAGTSFMYSGCASVPKNTVSTSFRAPEFKARYFIVLVIDGPRFTETYGDTSCQYIPKLGKELIHEGTLFYNFRNNGTTETNSGHVALVTGVYDKVSNGGKELSKYPSMFQYFLKSSNADRSKAWVITSKGKLQILTNTTDKKWKNTYMPYSYCGPNGNSADYGGDKLTFAKVLEVLDRDQPQLMLVNLLEADVRAHENKWDEYLRAIRNCDNYAYELWKHIQENPQLKDQTALFITNDHGRHLDGHKNGFINHGDGCEGCRHISLLALGPDFKKDAVITGEAEMIDISKTISQMMGFDMPTSKGRYLNEMMVNN